MRRMTGRSPPFAIVGVIVLFFFFSYNLWSLSSRNDDLANDLEKLQIQIKLCAERQAESDKSASLLQNNIKGLQSKLADSGKYAEVDKGLLKKTGTELSNLKNEQSKLHKIEVELKKDVEAKETRILELEKKLGLTIDMKDDLDLVIAEKDQLINKLQQHLEQVKRDLHVAYAQGIENSEKSSDDQNKVSPNAKASLKKPVIESVQTNSKGMYGNIEHPGIPLLPIQPPDVPKDKPKFTVLDAKPGKQHNNQVQAPNVEHDNVHQISNVQNVIHNPEALEKEPDLNVVNGPYQQQVIQKPMLVQENNVHGPMPPVLEPPKDRQRKGADNVLPLALQKLAENPDTAIDEEEKNIEDPADDQDEEGKEIKRDMEALPGVDGKKSFDEFNNNIDYEEDNERNGLQKNVIPKGENPDPRGIGIMGFPLSKDAVAGDDYVNFGGDPDHNDAKANDRHYDTNLSNKIRNIGKI